ncbi:serine phosphatase RsbU (regulator of sigma subunit) [Streptomyces sp. V4I23]|uniref:PP2C family protein-serine/threonine phosphatase n=1 Tax=Streptomyces sp. V4I23 TaxID=3042282 RepID=UPI00278805F6|nr:SpoIIE family protein phosphatase [Streptomyces sp. V4I23]MDQ1012728.1 serine phosphatase RsbU (regulator of sigma subunit) [Streptomyces sp. V4I23]
MPSHVFADRPAQPPERGAVDALITRTRRLRGDVDAVRQDTVGADDDPQGRWQRALYDLAVHHLDDLGAHLDQLKEGLPPATADAFADELAEYEADSAAGSGSLLSRVGSAEWNLLTDEVSWSDELYQILGRDPAAGPMSLDELPSVVFAEDQPLLTAMVTDCLVDGRPIDGEFRMVRPDGRVRTVHMMGEPVLDADGSTASMWAVLRDVSELRRSQRAVRETRDSLQRRRHIERTERRLAVEMQEAVLPSWRGPLRFPPGSPTSLDIAAHYLPSPDGALIGGEWYDALQLPDGASLLGVGDLTGHGVAATSSMAMLLGALRGMAVAGVRPGQLMAHLNRLLDTSAQSALGSAVCCRYDPATRVVTWAQAGHPTPLLFRDGTGRALSRLDGVLLGATSGASYEQGELTLQPGDVLVLHTDGLTRTRSGPQDAEVAADRLTALAARLTGTRDAQEGVRVVVEEFGQGERQGDACVLVAKVNA